jgi:hypothetical protein
MDAATGINDGIRAAVYIIPPSSSCTDRRLSVVRKGPVFANSLRIREKQGVAGNEPIVIVLVLSEACPP